LPFSGIAYAGHTNGGGKFCRCGCPDCVCDDDEVATQCGSGAVLLPSQNKSKSGINNSPATGGVSTDSTPDPGAASLFLLLLGFLWYKLRN
jgi:hypothetical protein